jgi:hypothetical protein
VVLPEVQLVGGLVDGPKTLNVIGLTSFEPEELAKVAVREVALMAVPVNPDAGAEAVSVGEAGPTTVLVTPQALAAALLLASAGADTYHQ